MKKRIFALLMALVMVFGLNTTFLAAGSPVGDNGAEAIYVEWIMENGQSTWTIKCENILEENTARADYTVKIYKDGKYVTSSWVWYYPEELTEDDEMVQIDVSDYITEAGKYYVELTAASMVYKEVDGHGTSLVAETIYEGYTSTADYVDPGKTLATPTNVAISNEGMVTFDLVEGAAYYEIALCFFDVQTGDGGLWDFITVYPEAGAAQGTFNLLKWLEEAGQVYDEDYSVAVRACSDDINVIKSSEFSEETEKYEFRISSEKAEGLLKEALESEDPYAVVRTVANTTAANLNTILNANPDMIAKIAAAENEYIKQLKEDGYDGADTVLPVCNVDGMDGTKIDVTGALLSALYFGADKVELSIGASTEEVTISEAYSNAVKLNIELLFDGKAPELLYSPVIITMPIPAGVAAENLVILHYHEEGKEPQKIVPIVNADGTMTFVVDGFSTFVVANEVPAGGTDNGGANNGGTYTEKSGGTGDNTPVEALVVIMILSAAVAVVAMKKKPVVK